MKLRTGLLIGLPLVVVLFFFGTATAEKKCEKVNAHMSDFVEYFGEDAASVCGSEFVNCGMARLVGTINGRYLYWDTGAGEWTFEFPAFGDTSTWRGPVTFETKHGEIYTTAIGVNTWLTFDVAAEYFPHETHVIQGGAGRYESATGVMILRWQYLKGVGELAGTICWPED